MAETSKFLALTTAPSVARPVACQFVAESLPLGNSPCRGKSFTQAQREAIEGLVLGRQVD